MADYAVLVPDRRKIKESRTALEAAGYYDSSRRIINIGPDSFALPVTVTCAETFNTFLQKHKTLPDPFTDFELIKADFPKSKKAQIKTEWENLRQTISDFLSNTKLGSSECTKYVSELPRSWEQHGDLVVLPQNSFTSAVWQTFGVTLWEVTAKALKCKRLALDRRVLCDKFRTSGAVLVLGEDGWVEHVENHVRYIFDITKCMFSSGNISEKLRIAGLDCADETVVDLYAGIGYFALPYLVHAGAKVVYACEWNPDAVEGLRRGLVANGVEDKCVIHFGDCRKVVPRGIADRVNLGLLPSSEAGWPAACAALNPSSGGWLHIHGNVCSKPGSLEFTETNPWERRQDPVALELKGTLKTEAISTGNKEELCGGDSRTAQSQDGVGRNIKPANNGVLEPANGAYTDIGEGFQSGNEFGGCHLQAVSHSPARTDVDSSADSYPILKKPSLKRSVWHKWVIYITRRVQSLIALENPLPPGREWSVCVQHLEHVKSYAPHVDHLVADVECRPVVL